MFWKRKFLVESWNVRLNFSVGGCWGQPMLLFWELVDETQIFKPQKHTFRQNLTCIFLSVRAILKETFQCETPCIQVINLKWHQTKTKHCDSVQWKNLIFYSPLFESFLSHVLRWGCLKSQLISERLAQTIVLEKWPFECP